MRSFVSADGAATIARMGSQAVAEHTVEALTTAELRALREAAAWYAKYHQRIIADVADDRSAAGTARRRHFDDLYTGLAKLGLKLSRPSR